LSVINVYRAWRRAKQVAAGTYQSPTIGQDSRVKHLVFGWKGRVLRLDDRYGPGLPGAVVLWEDPEVLASIEDDGNGTWYALGALNKLED
jgi:hypothetical protein